MPELINNGLGPFSWKYTGDRKAVSLKGLSGFRETDGFKRPEVIIDTANNRVTLKDTRGKVYRTFEGEDFAPDNLNHTLTGIGAAQRLLSMSSYFDLSRHQSLPEFAHFISLRAQAPGSPIGIYPRTKVIAGRASSCAMLTAI